METRLREEMPHRAEQEVEDLLATFVDAVHRKDLDGVMACFADDVVAFDLVPPLRYVGADAFRRLWQLGFAMPGRFELERHDLVIEAEGDLAFAHALDHARFEDRDGRPGELWLRWTGCLRRIDGEWKIVHEQTSVPMDLDTGRAVTTLTPATTAWRPRA